MDPRKRSFDDSVGTKDRKKHIKLESGTNSLDSVTLLSERKRETDLLAATSIVNGKINQLSALASIHATNVQRCSNPNYLPSESHQSRMEKVEVSMFRLTEEKDELNQDMQSRFSGSTETCDGNDNIMYKTPNVSSGLSVSRLISADANASSNASSQSIDAPNCLDPDTPNVSTPDDMI